MFETDPSNNAATTVPETTAPVNRLYAALVSTETGIFVVGGPGNGVSVCIEMTSALRTWLREDGRPVVVVDDGGEYFEAKSIAFYSVLREGRYAARSLAHVLETAAKVPAVVVVQGETDKQIASRLEQLGGGRPSLQALFRAGLLLTAHGTPNAMFSDLSAAAMWPAPAPAVRSSSEVLEGSGAAVASEPA